MTMRPLFTNLRLLGPAGLVLAVASAAAVLAALAGFLDPVSLLITIGGALGVTRVTFSRARLASAWAHLRAALSADADSEALIAAVKRLARVHRVDGAPALERAGAGAPDPFLRRAIALAAECRDEDELADTLTGELRLYATDGEAARHVVLTLGKLFPAFGLIGTLIGLVLLLRNLAGADFAAIGPGLGIAVLTTLYGAFLSNVVVLPLASKLHTHLGRRALVMQMIVEGTLLVYRKEYPTRIERVLRAHLGGAPAPGALSARPTIVERAA
jgi:chemotaxis protein MotA